MQKMPLMTPWLAAALVRQAGQMTGPEIRALQKERLLILLDYARQHSPFLREKYLQIPDCPELSDIPITLREEAMPQLDRWVCDPEITSSGLDSYLSRQDEASASSLFLGRYRVLTSSGTTGVPLRMVRDDRHNLIHAAVISQRLLGSGKTEGNPVPALPYPRTAGVLASGGYSSTYLSFLRTRQAYEAAGMAGEIMPLFVGMATGEMVAALNAFRPSLLTGYPSNIRVLASQQRLGKLDISPDLIACSAEHLSLEDIHYIEESFGCPVLNNYCSTEGGEVACLCRENHMHLNSDWVIVEPVDQNMRPLAPGQESDGILLTNLANLVQPFIRYYISDRIVLHEEACACGSPFPYMEIEGRKEDRLSFQDEQGSWICLPSSLFIDISLDTPNCGQVQFVQRGPSSLEIRCIPENGEGHEQLCRDLLTVTKDRLIREGLDKLELTTSQERPILGKSGKMRNTLILMDSERN
ncbi:MAG: phenylacetate--CoA ligase family protein [Clostridiaceae bacterium]|nr:phenylacetate--CoA ligase family protein [Clostridiaceae bacterium]